MNESKNVTSDTIVGLFILIALGVLLFGTFTIRGNFAVKTVTITATFDAVSGLEDGAPVLINGVRKGRVSAIRFDPKKANTVGSHGQYIAPPVTVRLIVAEVPMYDNAVIRLVQQGFIGDRRVEIDPGSPEGGKPIVDLDGHVFKGEPVFDMQRIFVRAENIVTDLEASLASFREFVTADETAKGLRQSLDNLTRSMQKAHDILERNEENVAVFVANSREASEDVKVVSARMRLLFEEGGRADSIVANSEEMVRELRTEFDDLSTRARTALESVNDTVARLDERSERLTTSGVSLLDTAREEYVTTAQNLQRSQEDLDVIIKRIRRGEGTLGRVLTDPKPFEDLKDSINAVRGILVGNEYRYYETEIGYRTVATPDGVTTPPATPVSAATAP